MQSNANQIKTFPSAQQKFKFSQLFSHLHTKKETFPCSLDFIYDFNFAQQPKPKKLKL